MDVETLPTITHKVIELQSSHGFARRVAIPDHCHVVEYFVLGYGVILFYQSIAKTRDGIEIWTQEKPTVH